MRFLSLGTAAVAAVSLGMAAAVSNTTSVSAVSTVSSGSPTITSLITTPTPIAASGLVDALIVSELRLVPTTSAHHLTSSSSTIKNVAVPSQLSTDIPWLSSVLPTSTSMLLYKCPPCDPTAAPKTVSIECMGGVLPAAPSKALGRCSHCPADQTKTSCYGAHLMTPASSMVTSTRSGSGSAPYTFHNGTVSMVHSTGSGAVRSGAIPTGELPPTSKSLSTVRSTKFVTHTRTTYTTRSRYVSSSKSSNVLPPAPFAAKAKDTAAVVMPTTTSPPCSAVTVTVTQVKTTVSTLTKTESTTSATKTGVDQASTGNSLAAQGASSARLTHAVGPHNDTISMGNGRPRVPKQPLSTAI